MKHVVWPGKPHKKKEYAFVQFKTREGFLRAVERGTITIQGWSANVVKAKREEKKKKRAKGQGGGGRRDQNEEIERIRAQKVQNI